MKTIYIKYHTDITPLVSNENSEWVDLRNAKDTLLSKGESALLDLGVSMKLPRGYEALLTLRSSTPLEYNIIQKNTPGVIDNRYCGNNDVWKLQVYALENTFIPFDARIAQFRIIKTQPYILFQSVDNLNEKDRGGFGSTGGF